MNWKKILILIISSFFIFINVDASCDSNRLKELKEIAQKVEFTYDYTIKNQSNSEVEFKITAVNLNQEVKLLIINDYYMDDYREFKYNSTKKNSLSGFKSGEKVKITFKAYTTDECSGKTVFSKTISLPYYNNFYDSDKCREYPNFKYCENKLFASYVSENQFNSELNKFINQDNNVKQEENNQNNNNTSFYFSEYIGLIIIVFITLLLVILIMVKIKQVKRKNYL